MHLLRQRQNLWIVWCIINTWNGEEEKCAKRIPQSKRWLLLFQGAPSWFFHVGCICPSDEKTNWVFVFIDFNVFRSKIYRTYQEIRSKTGKHLYHKQGLIILQVSLYPARDAVWWRRNEGHGPEQNVCSDPAFLSMAVSGTQSSCVTMGPAARRA